MLKYLDKQYIVEENFLQALKPEDIESGGDEESSRSSDSQTASSTTSASEVSYSDESSDSVAVSGEEDVEEIDKPKVDGDGEMVRVSRSVAINKQDFNTLKHYPARQMATAILQRVYGNDRSTHTLSGRCKNGFANRINSDVIEEIIDYVSKNKSYPAIALRDAIHNRLKYLRYKHQS